MTFKQFIAKLRPKVTKKIRIEVPAEFAQQLHDSANREVLKEATRETVGRYTARRDPPHFQGDEYHAHAELPGGYEAHGAYLEKGDTQLNFQRRCLLTRE
jgi:hypothetical protein